MMNTKAKFMIVTPTSPQKSTLIIVNNIISTIVPPPYISLTTKSRGVVSKHQRVKRWQHTPLIPIFYNLYNSTYLLVCLANKLNFLIFSKMGCHFYFFMLLY